MASKLDPDFWRLLLEDLPRSLRIVLLSLASISTSTAIILVGTRTQPGLLTDPVAFIKSVVVAWVLQNVVYPLVGGGIAFVAAIADLLLLVSLGTDRRVGLTGTPGLFELPIAGMVIISSPVFTLVGRLLAVTRAFNAGVVAWLQANGLGFLAFPATVVLVVVEAAVAGAILRALWDFIKVLDPTGVTTDLTGAIADRWDALTDWLREVTLA